MLTEKRQRLIETYVNEYELCSVAELCRISKTSESTIRRDLIQMEKAGILKRVHGGAQSVKNFTHDISQTVRFNINHEQKVRIAQYAVQNFVEAGAKIFIDAGTTTYEMVPFLAEVPKITVVTNGLETALRSLGQGIETILIGGKVKADTHAAVGQMALTQVKALNFSASFIGANGVDVKGNFTTPDPEEAAIKNAEIMQANRAYVLADASKIGKRNFAIFAQAQDAVLVTDQLTAQQKLAINKTLEFREVFQK